MHYIRFNSSGNIVEVSNDYPTGKFWDTDDGWKSTRDADSYEEALTWAQQLSVLTGEIWLGTDKTSGCSPRYRVIKAPKIGDMVSTCFNGDYYPQGAITKISPTWRIITSTGMKFSRRQNTSGWREQGKGNWSMVSGHNNDRNPSF